MATFLENFRTLNNQSKIAKPGTALPDGQDAINNFQEEVAIFNENRANIQRMLNENSRIREEIKQVSNGKVTVDKSINNKAELERILKSVKKMSELYGGALMPYYSVVANDELYGKTLGMTEAVRNKIGHESKDPLMRFISWMPSDYYGTKNNPYRITLDNANDIIRNDYIAAQDAIDGWSTWRNGEETAESDVHTHELGHTAQFGALKNTADPRLTTNLEERKKRQDFRDTHPSLQEIFDIAAINTGFDNIYDAASTISGYAKQDAEREIRRGGWNKKNNWSLSDRLPEVFAEAYTDVITNEDKASPYSKELIKLYVDYVNEYRKTFNNALIQTDNKILPKANNNIDFINSLRELYFGKKK